MQIEETIFDDYLPINSLVMLNRLKEILREKKTNCLLEIRNDVRVRKIIYLLVNQINTSFDISKEYIELLRLNNIVEN